MSEISRVVMLWPADLKDRIHKRVGRRGLTAYVLEAVREKEARLAAPVLTPEIIEEQNRITAVYTERVMPALLASIKSACEVCGTDLDDKGGCWLCGT